MAGCGGVRGGQEEGCSGHVQTEPAEPMAVRLFCIFFALLGMVFTQLGHLMQHGDKCAHQVRDSGQVREWLGNRMSHFQKRDSGGNGVQYQEGCDGENGGLIGLREQSPEWSLIITMSNPGMRRTTGIKAATGSCRKQSWRRGRALLSHSSGQRHRPVLCSPGPSVGIVSNVSSAALLSGLLISLLLPLLLFSHMEGRSYTENFRSTFTTLSTAVFGDYVVRRLARWGLRCLHLPSLGIHLRCLIGIPCE